MRPPVDVDRASSGGDQLFEFPQIPCRGATLPARALPPHDLAYLYLRNKLSDITMDSEQRRTLLKAPSTSVSAALVRSPCSKHRNTTDCATNAELLLFRSLDCLRRLSTIRGL